MFPFTFPTSRFVLRDFQLFQYSSSHCGTASLGLSSSLTMQLSTLLGFFCVFSAVTSSVPPEGDFTVTFAPVGTFEVTVRDWMSDIIQIILGVEVGELLSSIYSSLKALNVFILNAVATMSQIKARLDPAARLILEQIIESALSKAVNVTKPIASDLEMVLPAISNRALETEASRLRFSDAADLIQAILGISLEQLLSNIATALEASDVLLLDTMSEVKSLASGIGDPDLSSDLNEASTEYLTQGRAVIGPVLDQLYRVLPSRATPKATGMLADIISGVLQFDVGQAANEFSQSWYVSSRGILNESLDDLHRMFGVNWTLETSISEVIDSSVTSVRRTINPLIHVLVHFASNTGRVSYQLDNDLPRDIVNSLLGVSLADFVSYVDFSLERTMAEINSCLQKISDLAAVHARPLVAERVNTWALDTVNRLASALHPFLQVIAPILPPEWTGIPRTWAKSPEEFLRSSRVNTLCDFSLKTGMNKDLILNLISEILGFDTMEGATTLLTSMTSVQEILTSQVNQIAEVVDPQVMSKVMNLVNAAVNHTQVAAQPGLDIFLLFSPNMTQRHGKDVLGDVVRAFSSVTYRNFVLYIAYAGRNISDLVTSTTLQIHEVVALTSPPEVTEQVSSILSEATFLSTRAFQPFLDLIKPLLINNPDDR